MYLNFYHLREYPFTLACDPRFLYFSAGHREAMSGLLYGLRERKGAALLVGEPGTGKTTLLAAVLEMLPGGVVARSLDTPLHATPAEALRAVLAGFGLPAEPGESGLSTMTAHLSRYLDGERRNGRCMLLIIDEAQDLNPLVLEQMRLLTNLEAGGAKLLQIILSGQPELSAHLRHSNGRALDQRIAVRCRLLALTGTEAAAYIEARLQQAGAANPLFSPDATARIHALTHGVPRLINVLADHCLLAGFAAQAPRVDGALVERAAQQLELSPGTPAAPAPAAPPRPAHPRPPVLQRFAAGWARWAGLAAGGK